MTRAMPWILAVVCAMAGVGLWYYRVQASTNPDRAQELVQKAWSVERRVPREGEQTIRDPAMEAETITARVATSAEGFVRIEYLSEPLKGVTIWENGDRTYRYNPHAKRLTIARKRTTTEDDERQELQLLQNYDARIVGDAEVAGRPVWVVDLHPRSQIDRWKRFWIDRETYLVLASEDRRGKDEVLRSVRYTRVRYLDRDEQFETAEFRPPDALVERYGAARPGDTSSRFEPDRLSKLVGFPIREPDWLPPGFAREGAYQTPCHCEARHQAARLEYSDGLVTISLFQCGHPECRSAGNCFGPDGSTSLAVGLEHEGASYLAIGDVPRADLEHMVRSAAGVSP